MDSVDSMTNIILLSATKNFSVTKDIFTNN